MCKVPCSSARMNKKGEKIIAIKMGKTRLPFFVISKNGENKTSQTKIIIDIKENKNPVYLF